MMMAMAAAAESGEFDFRRGYDKNNLLRVFLHESGDRMLVNGDETIWLPTANASRSCHAASTNTTTCATQGSLDNHSILKDSLVPKTTTRTTRRKRRQSRNKNNHKDNHKDNEDDSDDDDDGVVVDWNQIKAVKLHGCLATFLVQNPTALEALFLEVVALPQLEKLRIVVPFQLPNLRRFLRILRNVWLETEWNLKEITLDDKGKSIVVQGTMNNNKKGSNKKEVRTLEIGLHSSSDCTPTTAVPGHTTKYRKENLHDPLLKELVWLDLKKNTSSSSSLTSVTWQGCPLMADTFQQFCGVSSLTELHISRVLVDAFHVTTLVQALTPPAALSAAAATAAASSKTLNRPKKRKRSSSITTNTTAMGTNILLPSLTTLVLEDIKIYKDSFLALCQMMKHNASIRSLKWKDICVRPSFAYECELWGPIFDFVKQNSTLQQLVVKEIFNTCECAHPRQHHADGDDRPCSTIQLDDEYTMFMAAGLHNALKHSNHTLQQVDFGFQPAHPSVVLDLLHLNVFGLRPFMGETTSSRRSSISATAALDEDNQKEQKENGMPAEEEENNDDHLAAAAVAAAPPFTKHDFHCGLIHAVELDGNDDDTTPPLVPSLFKLFQENPTLVDYLIC